MKHRVKGRKLGRTRDQREALLRSLACSLIEHGRIETTVARAKELRPYAEKLITKGRNDNLSTRRLLISKLGGRDECAKKLVEDISPRYSDRPGGYTRIVKLPPRGSDGAQMAIIEFV